MPYKEKDDSISSDSNSILDSEDEISPSEEDPYSFP
jgi:hypothetical protein